MNYPEKITEKRWNFLLRYDSHLWETRDVGWRQVQLAAFYLRKFPPDGAAFSRKECWGFWLRFQFWLPFRVSFW